MEPVQALQWVMDQPWYHAFTSMVASAAVIAALTPSKADNVVLKWLKFIIDIVGFNWGGAKNADAAKK